MIFDRISVRDFHSLSIFKLVLWAFSIVALSEKLHGDELKIGKAICNDPRLMRHAHCELTVPNQLAVPINLDSLDLEVIDREEITWTEPKLEMIPFLNYFVIKIRNDGWSEFLGRELDILATKGDYGYNDDGSGYPTGGWWGTKNDERIRNLLENKSGIIKLQESIKDHKYYFLKLHDDAEPFFYMYSKGARLEVPTKQPPFLSMKLFNGVRANTVFPHWVTEDREYLDRSGQKKILKGATGQLHGRLQSKDYGISEQCFVSTVLQMHPFTETELYVGELLHTPLSGGITEPGTFCFGIHKPVYAQNESSIIRYGITVDLRATNSRKYEIKIPINRLVDPNEDNAPQSAANAAEPPSVSPKPNGALKFDLAFVTDRPSKFTINAGITWHLGNAPKQRLERAKLSVRTTFPQDHDYSWKATEEFIDSLIKFDSNSLTKSRKIIDSKSTIYSKVVPENLSYSQNRLLMDAFQLLYTYRSSEDEERLKLFANWVLDSNDDDAYTRQRIAVELFPILCRINPNKSLVFFKNSLKNQLAANQKQVEKVSSGEKKNLPGVISRLDFLAILPAILTNDLLLSEVLKEQSDVKTWLERTKQHENWGPAEFMLACHLRFSEVEETVNKSSNLYGCITWVASKTKNKKTADFLTEIVRQRLSDDISSEEVILQIMTSAKIGNYNEIHDDVVKFLKSRNRDNLTANTMFAGLQYLKQVGIKEGDRVLLQELKEYPDRSEVRDLALKLLSQ